MDNKGQNRGYYYRGYGLRIKSQLEIKEFINIEPCDDFQVEILIDEVPLEHRTDTDSNKKVRFTKNRFCFYIKDVAMYYIKNPNTIIIEPSVGGNINHLKTYLLGVCMGLLLYMRKTLAIHGAAMRMKDKGVIFLGSSGAGKSTLTSVLMERGHEFLSDDISVITSEDGIKVHPGYGGQRFCKDVVEYFGYEEEDYEIINRHGKEKYIVPFKKEFQGNARVLGYIFYLSVTKKSKVSIEEIRGMDKVNLILEKIYGLHYMKRKGIHREILEEAMRVAHLVPIYEIKRPKDLDTRQEIIARVEEIVLKERTDKVSTI